MPPPRSQEPSCAGVISRSVPLELRQPRQHGGKNFLSKCLPRIVRVGPVPSCLSKYPTRRSHKRERRAKKNEQKSRWKRFLVRSVSGVEYLHRRNFFRFLHFGQFVLLCKSLENRFLNFSSSIQI